MAEGCPAGKNRVSYSSQGGTDFENPRRQVGSLGIYQSFVQKLSKDFGRTTGF